MTQGFPHSSVGKESACNAGNPGSIPGSGRPSWKRDRLPTPVFLGFSCDLAGKESACNTGDFGSDPLKKGQATHSSILAWRIPWTSPWGRKEWDMTEQLLRDSDSISGSGRSPGRGKCNPLQYSCLENPMERGAWQATHHGVTESQTGPLYWAWKDPGRHSHRSRKLYTLLETWRNDKWSWKASLLRFRSTLKAQPNSQAPLELAGASIATTCWFNISLSVQSYSPLPPYK